MSTTTPEQWLALAEWIENAPPYTSSLDAFSTLFILGMPKENGFVGGYEARLWLKNDLSLGSRGSGSTLALALCAAFCRTMAERD
jgi:hypothetical protein